MSTSTLPQNILDLDFEEVRDFPPSVMEKVGKMKQKTDLVIQLFNVPNSEKVIQDYRCSINTGDQEGSGKVFITQNYLLFASSDRSILEPIAFFRIMSVTKDKSLLFFPAGITIELDSGKVQFSGFMHRDETFNLIRHLWTFQPNYVHLSDTDMLSQIKDAFDVDDEVKQEVQQKLDASAGKKSNGEFSGRWGELADEIKTVEECEVPDLDIGKRSMRLAHEIEAINTQTLERMQQQAESLDRTEHHLKETNNNLNQANRQLDGLETGVGQVKNMFTPNLHKNKVGAFEKSDRTVNIDNEEYTDIPILIKQPNDFLEPGLMRFGEKRLRCLNGERKEIKKYSYTYRDLYQVIVRARHQHLDIKFRHTQDRFRCCTSFIQAFVNEIFLRTSPGQVVLVHEPETRRFQYGNFAIRELTLRGARDGDDGNDFESNSGGGFITPKATYSTLLDGAPGAVQEAQQVQDSQINDLSKIMSDLDSINSAMDGELNRQIDQLDKVDKMANKTLKNANQATYRTTKLK